MNKQFSLKSFDQGVYKTLYYRYKDYLAPIAVILICIVLFIKVTLFQLQDLIETKRQEQVTTEKIAQLRNKLQFLQALNKDQLDSQLQTATEVLPVGKDFSGALNAMMNASNKSGVILGDFTFEVGDLSTPSAIQTGKPSLKVNLSVKGTVEATKSFLVNLSQVSPISEVNDIQISKDSSNMIVFFYYKPIPSIKQDSELPVKSLSREDLRLLQTLSGWGKSETILQSTNSATPSL